MPSANIVNVHLMSVVIKYVQIMGSYTELCGTPRSAALA